MEFNSIMLRLLIFLIKSLLSEQIFSERFKKNMERFKTVISTIGTKQKILIRNIFYYSFEYDEDNLNNQYNYLKKTLSDQQLLRVLWKIRFNFHNVIRLRHDEIEADFSLR